MTSQILSKIYIFKIQSIAVGFIPKHKEREERNRSDTTAALGREIGLMTRRGVVIEMKVWCS